MAYSSGTSCRSDSSIEDFMIRVERNFGMAPRPVESTYDTSDNTSRTINSIPTISSGMSCSSDSSIARDAEFMIRMDNWKVQRTFYDYNTTDNASTSSSIPSTFYDISRACTPTINTDIAAHRTLQEADALKARVAEFMERMANWKAERNFGIAPRPVDPIVPKKPKVDDPHVVQSLTAVGNSPFLQITCPVIKSAFVLERWLFCEFTINLDSAFTSLSKQIFDKVVMVATNKPTIGRFGYTTMKVARVHKPEDVALVTMLVVDNEEALPAVLGRNAIKYFWPGAVTIANLIKF